MCGIFLYKNNKSDTKIDTLGIAYKGIKDLEYRGYDSFGIFSFNTITKENNLYKRVGKVSDETFEKEITRISGESDFDVSLGHTRWATHGAVNLENTHPHKSFAEKFVLVHNGIFENYLEYKTKFENAGVKFYSETDSEVLVNLIEQEGIENIFSKVKGSNAFILINTHTGEVVAARNGSALYIGRTDDGDALVSSDVSGLLAYAKNIYTVKDSEMIELDKIEALNYEKIERVEEISEKGDFDTFMLKEIFDQGHTVARAYESTGALDKDFLKNKQIIFTGCGTAYHVCLAAGYIGAKNGIDIKAIPANEFNSFEKIISKNTLLFAVSQSGETADTIIAAKKVIECGGEVYSILNNQYSTLAQISNRVFAIGSGKEVSVASTKAFTAQLATVMALFDLGNKKDFENFKKEIKSFIENKDLHSQIKNIAEKYKDKKDIFIIGKGLCMPIALETSLKIKEITYIHTEGFAAGELKHGVISLIEPGVLSIVCDADSQFSDDLESSATQIKSRGGEVLGIGFLNKNYYDDYIEHKDFGNFSFIINAIVGQLLAYYIAISKDLDPDKPRNLAKSVTVR